jgi:hypothetical protein
MAEEIQSFRQIRSVLDPAKVDNNVKAAAFDAFYDATSPEDFVNRFKSINLPEDTKAQLWDMRFGQEQAEAKEKGSPFTVPKAGRLALEEMPGAGAVLGGAAMGPAGAVGGGILGKGLQRAIKYRMGEAPPAQAGEFATDVGLEGLKQGAFELAGPLTKLAVGRPLEKAGESVYRSSLQFPGYVDEAERTASTKLGRELSIPAGKGGGMVARRGLPQLEQFIKENVALVNQEVAAAERAGKVAETGPVFQRLRERIAKYAEGLAPSEPVAAAEAIMADVKKRLGGGTEKINIDISGSLPQPLEAPHVVKRPPAKFKEVEIERPPKSEVTPTEMLKAKRRTSKDIRESAYGEEKGPKVEALKAAERGAKESLEKAAPGVKIPNERVHEAMYLRDAIENTVKNNPGLLKDYWSQALAAGGLGIALSGHPVGHAAMIAGIVHAMLHNPAARSRIGLALAKAGTVLPTLGKVGGQAARFLTPAASLPDMPETQLPQGIGR